jgi:hypothetical protein
MMRRSMKFDSWSFMGKARISGKTRKAQYGLKIGCVFLTSKRFGRWFLRKLMRQPIPYTLAARRCTKTWRKDSGGTTWKGI